MFTGLIEEKGTITDIRKECRSGQLKISCSRITEDMKTGDSIAVDGICLTVTVFDKNSFWADFMMETWKVTNLMEAHVGSKVNLERALLPGDRLGGHVVSGHVDGTGKIRKFVRRSNSTEVFIDADRSILKYIVKKGSVALDGASLTVAELSSEGFMVSIIPHTAKAVTLLEKRVGQRINIECDSIGKYQERLLENDNPKQGSLSYDILAKNGFI